jgi:hypothetical protein
MQVEKPVKIPHKSQRVFDDGNSSKISIPPYSHAFNASKQLLKSIVNK